MFVSVWVSRCERARKRAIERKEWAVSRRALEPRHLHHHQHDWSGKTFINTDMIDILLSRLQLIILSVKKDYIYRTSRKCWHYRSYIVPWAKLSYKCDNDRTSGNAAPAAILWRKIWISWENCVIMWWSVLILWRWPQTNQTNVHCEIRTCVWLILKQQQMHPGRHLSRWSFTCGPGCSYQCVDTWTSHRKDVNIRFQQDAQRIPKSTLRIPAVFGTRYTPCTRTPLHSAQYWTV